MLRSNQEEKKFAAIRAHEELLESGHNETNVTVPVVDTITNVSIFSGIIGAVFLFGLLRALLFFKVAINASQILHNRMFARILRTPISFFDTNPVGKCRSAEKRKTSLNCQTIGFWLMYRGEPLWMRQAWQLEPQVGTEPPCLCECVAMLSPTDLLWFC